MSKWTVIMCVGAVLAAMTCQPLWAQGPNPPAKAKPAARAETIDDALKSPTTLEFIETPLEDVAAYLKDLHRIRIEIDRRAFKDAHVSTSKTVTINLKGVSLCSALRLMCRQLDLVCVPQAEYLMITTPEGASKWGPPLSPIGMTSGEAASQPTPAEKKIREALNAKVTVEFVETPLSDVTDYLSDLLKITVFLDRKALGAVGGPEKTLVTVNMKNVTLSAALGRILREHHLTHLVQDEVLLITQPGAVKAR